MIGPIACPYCATLHVPAELLAHVDERCPGTLPEPASGARWRTREQALRLASGRRLDGWRERGLLRAHPDGRVLERDLVLLTVWARALGAL